MSHRAGASGGSALITGASGFIGRRLVAALRARGMEVRALARPGGGKRGAQAREALVVAGATVVLSDICDGQQLQTALEGVHTVYHLAGRLLLPGVPDAVYEQIHVEGTRTLLHACAAAKPLRAIVHCSTTGVLGPTGPRALDEQAPLRPVTIYERSKANGERLAQALAAQHRLPLVVARPALVYGPGDLHLLGWFRAIKRGLYRVIGTGSSLLHPIYIDDLIDGLLRCAARPQPRGRVYHLVGERALPIGALAGVIAQALGRELPKTHLPLGPTLAAATLLEQLPVPPAWLPLTRSRVMFMSESRAYSGCRASTELGFTPQTSLASGLAQTVAWYREEGLL